MLADLDRDGKPDLVVTVPASNAVTIWKGVGDGTFTALPGSTITLDGSPDAVTVGDVNGDGKLDLVSAMRLAGRVTGMLGNGDDTFQKSTFLETSARPIALGDVDNDPGGRLDMAIIKLAASNAVSIRLGVP